MTDDLKSPEQDNWIGIARQVRFALEKRVPEIGAMEPSEMKDFLETLQLAEDLELNAELRDLRKKDFENSINTEM